MTSDSSVSGSSASDSPTPDSPVSMPPQRDTRKPRHAAWGTFLSTLRMELRCTLRTPAALFWLIAFPIILATLIQTVFGGVASYATLTPAKVAVVQDSAWESSYGASEFMDAVSGKSDSDSSSGSSATSSSASSAASSSSSAASSSVTLIDRIDVSSVEEAQRLLDSGDAMAYVSVTQASEAQSMSQSTSQSATSSESATPSSTSDSVSTTLSHSSSGTDAAAQFGAGAGTMHLTMSQSAAQAISQAGSSGGSSDAGSAWSLIALETFIEQYNTRAGIITSAVTQAITDRMSQMAAQDHSKLNDAVWIESVVADAIASADTANSTSTATYLAPAQGYASPQPMARYHFAIVAMAALMAMSLACEQITKLQANLSELGARICASPLGRVPKVTAVALAVWFETFVCLVIDFAYVRFVMGVPIHGLDGLAVAALAMAAFASAGLGLALGAIPRLPVGAKTGISILITLLLSAFTGMYGNMAFADAVQRAVPWLQYLNPCKQVTNLFYDLLYYHSLAPFAHTTLVLAAMGVLGLVVAAFELRRTSYDNL